MWRISIYEILGLDFSKKHTIPLRFRKAGRVWCGGARKTHRATCHDGVTPCKTKDFLNYPCFLDLNGSP